MTYFDISNPFAPEIVCKASKALRELRDNITWNRMDPADLPTDAKVIATFGSADIGSYNNCYYYSPSERRFYFQSEYEARDESRPVQSERSEVVRVE